MAYFRTMRIFISTMFFMTVIFLPIFYMYHHGNVYKHGEKFLFANYALGNLGHANVNCNHQILEIDKHFHYKCKAGNIQKLLYSGIIPSGSEKKDIPPNFCLNHDSPTTYYVKKCTE